MKNRVSFGTCLLLGLICVIPAQLFGRDNQSNHPVAMPHPMRGDSRELPAFTPEREAAALTFIRRERPRLLEVVRKLKSHNQEEYRRAIRQFFHTSERLADIRDVGQRAMMLKTWKVRMQIQMLTAQLVGSPDQAGKLEPELQKAVNALVQLQLEQSALQIERTKRQLKQLENQKQQLEARREDIARQHMQNALRQVRKHKALRAEKQK